MGLGKIDFERIVMCAAEVGISDIHIAEGEPVYWRRCGCLSPLREFIPTAEDIRIVAKKIDYYGKGFKYSLGI